MSAGRRIASNVVALTLSKAATLGLSLLIWVHLARVLTADGVGVLTFGTAILAYFLLAIGLGFDAVTVRELARDHSRVHDLVPAVLGLRLALLAVAALVYVGVVLLLPQPASEQIVLLVLGALLLVRAVQIDWVYQGLEKMGAIAIRDVVTSVVVAVGAFLFVRSPADVLPAAVVLVAGPLLSNASLLLAYSRHHGSIIPRVDWATWRAILGPAVLLAASGFITEVFYSLDKVMLEFFRSTPEVGLYGMGHKVFILALAPSGILYGAFFPALAHALGSRSQMLAVGEAYARVQLGIGFSVTAAGVVLAGDLVVALFGPEYAEAGGALRVLFLNAGVVYANMVYGIPLMAWDRQRAYFWAVLVGGVANVGLNVALIRPFGIEGAATATLFSEGIVLVGLAALYRQATGSVFSGIAARAVGAALVGAALPAAILTGYGASVFVSAPLVALLALGTLRATGLLVPATFRSLLRPDP